MEIVRAHRCFNTYIGFIVNLSTRFNKQFNNTSVTTARSMMKRCPTIL